MEEPSHAELNDPLTTFGKVLPVHSGLSADGALMIGGCDVRDLVATYGSPLYVFDELGLREQCRSLTSGLTARWPNSKVLFASKSMPAVAMYRLVSDEGLCVDVAGLGELELALAAGVDPATIYLHGNAKSDAEIKRAIDVGVAAIIADNFDDLTTINEFASTPQHVLLRVIPDVAPDVHESQSTGGHASKFGIPLSQLEKAKQLVDALEHVTLGGIHMHIGSQVLDTTPFVEAVHNIASIGRFATYDIGGGLGVTYTDDELAPAVDEYLDAVVGAAREVLPDDATLMIEPGRSVVARAGVILYTINRVKHSNKTFVAVNGGMADNIDVALTGQHFEALVANHATTGEPVTADLVGRQCESGDLIRADVELLSPHRGDIVAVTTTGAYSYTLANNYNGALKPAVVFCADGNARIAVQRETIADLLRHHQR